MRICKLIGHKYDPIAAEHHVTSCLRCGATDYDNGHESVRQPWHVDRLNLIRWRLELRWIAVRNAVARWWRCPDCGERLGRHDETNCLPF